MRQLKQTSNNDTNNSSKLDRTQSLLYIKAILTITLHILLALCKFKSCYYFSFIQSFFTC